MLLFSTLPLMSNHVQSADKEFPFSDLTLANPQGLQGGAYFSKLRIHSEPVIIQTPKCFTKNGIHKTEKKIYCDLMFTQADDDFIQWVDTLESTVKSLIYEKRDMWFHNDMDYDSIDYHWQNLLRTYKSNKSLLRCFFQKPRGLGMKKMVQIYDEEEKDLKIDDINKDSCLVTILEVSGLKFTTQSFQVEFIIKQIMVLKNDPIFSKCLIKISDKPRGDKTAPITLEISEGNSKQSDDSDAESDISIAGSESEKDDTPPPITEVTDSSNNVAPVETQEMTLPEVISPQTDNPDSSCNLVTQNAVLDSSNNLVGQTDPLEKKAEGDLETSEPLERKAVLDEINILVPQSSEETLTLKKPNEVYMEIYKEAKRKAKEAKKMAVHAYLEAKRIKSLYLLDAVESSDDDLENYGEYTD